MREHDGIDKDPAAAMVGVSRRSLDAYRTRGLIRPQRGAGGAVKKSDVQRVRAARTGAGTDPLRRLEARLCDLDARVSVAARLLGFHKEPLGYTAEQLSSLRKMAAYHAIDGWSPHVAPVFVDLFERITLDDVEALAEVADEEHPWAEFYRLCGTMRLFPHDAEMSTRLDAGKDNLYQVATLWCHLRGLTPRATRRVLATGGKTDGRVVGKLRRRRQRGASE